jgi:sulfite exporter TauE/SafE
MQRHGKHLSTLPIVIRVTLMTRYVSIVQRMKCHADVRGIFVVRAIVAAVTGSAAFFARVNSVPFSFVRYRMCRRMARAARRLGIIALCHGSLWRKQHDQPDCQCDE